MAKEAFAFVQIEQDPHWITRKRRFLEGLERPGELYDKLSKCTEAKEFDRKPRQNFRNRISDSISGYSNRSGFEVYCNLYLWPALYQSNRLSGVPRVSLVSFCKARVSNILKQQQVAFAFRGDLVSRQATFQFVTTQSVKFVENFGEPRRYRFAVRFYWHYYDQIWPRTFKLKTRFIG